MRTPASWDETWLSVAIVVSKRSKDPRMQVGAVLVSPDNSSVSVGYNGFPRGIQDTAERWERPIKYKYCIHAELNAMLNCPVRPAGWTLYLTIPPCSDCALKIVQAGIKKVIYRWDPNPDSQLDYDFSKQILDEANVQLEQFVGVPPANEKDYW